MSASWDEIMNIDDMEIEDDPFDGSDDEDRDYEPEEESDDYDSDEDAIDQQTLEEIAVQPNEKYVSKDKTIVYSNEPLQAAGRHTAIRGETGVTAYARGKVSGPVSAYLLFLEPIEDVILSMTNLYGVRKYKSGWEMLDICTLRAYFGLLILAGVYRSHGEDITELWNNDNGRPIFRATMSLKKFKVIHQCIRFDDKENRSERRERDKLAAIRVVYNKWVANLKALYIPGRNVTVDEQLVPYRGRCPFTMYIPSKPHRYGIKIWCLCDAETYYAYNMEVYVGRHRSCHAEVNQGRRVVLQLTEGLEGRNVTCDNFFTSHSLAVELQKRKMTLVGTIRKNRKELPPIVLDMKRKPVHHSEFVFDHANKAVIVSYIPKRNKFVTLLSTYHKGNRTDPNDKNKPEIIKFYNTTKAGVDVLDEMVGTYRCTRKVNRWTMNLFGNMLDISGVNAAVIFFSLNPQWNERKKGFRRRLFLLDVRMSLVKPYIEGRAVTPRGEHSASVVRRMRGEEDAESNEEASTSGISKTPASNKRARCHICPARRSTNVHSARCDKCKKAICSDHRYLICDKCFEPYL